MNQLRDWEGKCHRCGSESDFHTMSMFDVALICMECLTFERNHPDYPRAKSAEEEEVKRGNLNFEGIGYPEKS